MTKTQQVVCSFIKVANGYDSVSLPLVLDYGKVFKMACQQGVACLVFDGLEILVGKIGKENFPKDFILRLYARKAQIEKTMLEKKKLIQEFGNLMSPMQGFVLKGLDFAQYWQKPLYREYGDFDCFFGDDYENINRKAAELGAKVEYSTHKHSHIYYKGLMIENHQTLTDFDGSRVGERTEKILTELLDEASGSSLPDSSLLSPNPMFTACFMLKHAQQHFMTEGIELRHFLDWMFFIDKMGNGIDWERLGRLLEDMKLRNFAEMMTAYCMTRLGWKPQIPIVNSPLGYAVWLVQELSILDSPLLDKVDDFVFSEKADVQNKQPVYRAKRILKRFVRAWHFRKLHCLPYHKAVWAWIAYASTLDRKPSKVLS